MKISKLIRTTAYPQTILVLVTKLPERCHQALSNAELLAKIDRRMDKDCRRHFLEPDA
jgi:hypothetical protein